MRLRLLFTTTVVDWTRICVHLSPAIMEFPTSFVMKLLVYISLITHFPIILPFSEGSARTIVLGQN